MAKISFSGQNLGLAQSIDYHIDLDASLQLFFSNASPTYAIRFFGLKREEVDEILAARIEELDLTTTMSILASVEAAFRIDYLKRCYEKKTDGLSRKFRDIYKTKNERASLEEDIIETWKSNTLGSTLLFSELKGAFKFRHWLAHGRYWVPKLGRKYDHSYVYQLAIGAFQLPLLG